jgi:hypothetical protein
MFDQKVKALELAVQGGGTATEIVTRATAYEGFLSGTKPAAGAAAAATTKAPATPPPAGKATTAKATATGAATGAAAANGAGKPNGATPPAGKPNGAAPAATKPAAAKAATPGAGASAQAVPSDTKAPGGVNTYADVVNKLRDVMTKFTDPASPNAGRVKALGILTEIGKAKSVRELKPALYDTVVTALDAALTESEAADAEDALGDPPEHTGGGLDVEDPTAQEPRDELGM